MMQSKERTKKTGKVHERHVDWDSVVSTATNYGLDGPGIQTRRVRVMPQTRPALGSTQPPSQWVPVLFPGSKAAGLWL